MSAADRLDEVLRSLEAEEEQAQDELRAACASVQELYQKLLNLYELSGYTPPPIKSYNQDRSTRWRIGVRHVEVSIGGVTAPAFDRKHRKHRPKLLPFLSTIEELLCKEFEEHAMQRTSSLLSAREEYRRVLPNTSDSLLELVTDPTISAYIVQARKDLLSGNTRGTARNAGCMLESMLMKSLSGDFDGKKLKELVDVAIAQGLSPEQEWLFKDGSRVSTNPLAEFVRLVRNDQSHGEGKSTSRPAPTHEHAEFTLNLACALAIYCHRAVQLRDS